MKPETSSPVFSETPIDMDISQIKDVNCSGTAAPADITMDLDLTSLDHTANDTSVEIIAPPVSTMEDSSLTPSNDELSLQDSSPSVRGSVSNSGRFMDVPELFQTVINAKDIQSEIPVGIKENETFICDNSQNISRRSMSRRIKFVDDCGVWGKGSTKKHFYHFVNGKFTYLEQKEGLYCVMKKSMRVPMAIQPPNSEVLIVKRYYNKLKRCADYHKRVTWIEQFPTGHAPVHPQVPIVEYTGKFPESCAIHGNSKKSTAEFVRTPDTVIEQIREEVKTQPARDVYNKHLQQGEQLAARDLKQVQNLKQSVRKDKGTKRQNTADDLISIINSIHTNEFIQEIIQCKGKPPSVILYTQVQIKELKQFCTSASEKPVVVGVGRTFNLGACFVTLLVFQHPNLHRKGTETHPIMLGPLYLHWDGSYLTYHRFFSHIQALLDSNLGGTQTQGKQLVIGSDEERGLIKALRNCFPASTHILCERHIEQNIKRHLRHQAGASDQQIRLIHQKIFGPSGLVNSHDSYQFELNQMELEDIVSTTVPDSSSYLSKVIKTIKTDIFLPSKERPKAVPLHWTNNACESMNNIIKLSTNWKSLKIPDLTDKLHTIVKIQYADMRRALYGQGNYQLTPWMAGFKLSNACWTSKSQQEKDRHFRKFLRGPRCQKSITVSSDGRLNIPKTPQTARKPEQRKRIKTAKTFTF
ncbi:uncharacterized protein LOC124126896 [Haliotis rufescens]|uniref:uncharacterized protein LOC124126896 n=1 Tax=Haliotis rufescens TaxID=6454 RepID=UPI001EB051F4|nr:uncharacterized protein LOC124126896 [Haliotis rufescens]XP_048252051.1 uncharacterized protein LOC124126896 [Haliotis rufescens]XP_048252052.1 uncharacterized protein LOC124126896 [Haliotis rufescens]